MLGFEGLGTRVQGYPHSSNGGLAWLVTIDTLLTGLLRLCIEIIIIISGIPSSSNRDCISAGELVRQQVVYFNLSLLNFSTNFDLIR